MAKNFKADVKNLTAERQDGKGCQHRAASTRPRGCADKGAVALTGLGTIRSVALCLSTASARDDVHPLAGTPTLQLAQQISPHVGYSLIVLAIAERWPETNCDGSQCALTIAVDLHLLHTRNHAMQMFRRAVQ
jgi:hypothetical protein